MKTLAQHIQILVLFAIVTAVAGGVEAQQVNEKQFEASRRERNRDFEKVVKSRERSPKAEALAAEAARAARAKRDSEIAKAQAAFVAKMKRYSMEEIEAKDQADVRRLEELQSKKRNEREQFVAMRERLRKIDARVGDVNSYKEFSTLR